MTSCHDGETSCHDGVTSCSPPVVLVVKEGDHVGENVIIGLLLPKEHA